jgi:hypothetical protein
MTRILHAQLADDPLILMSHLIIPRLLFRCKDFFMAQTSTVFVAYLVCRAKVTVFPLSSKSVERTICCEVNH